MTRGRPTRAQETRAAEERYATDEAAMSPLHIDPTEIPPDMVYRWVRMSVRGQQDEANVLNRTRDGWVPVPAERHQSYSKGRLFPGMRSSVDDDTIIRHVDMVLCEKSKRAVERDREKMNRENIEILQSTPGLENLPGGYVKQNTQGISRAGFQGD